MRLQRNDKTARHGARVGVLRRAKGALADHGERARTAAAERIAAMEESASTTTKGTRRRSGVAALAGFLALGSMYGMVTASVMAVGFTTANSQYDVYTDRVVGQYAAGYMSAQSKADGEDVPVAQLGFKTAELSGLCVIATQAMFGPTPDVSLVIRGGEPVDGTVTTEPSSPDLISANELYLASDSLRGRGENITSMTLGQSANTLTMQDINTHRGQAGDFGLQAELMQIANLDADSYGIDLQGSINMPDLSIEVVPGVATKSACS